jgi:hypothetical protein
MWDMTLYHIPSAHLQVSFDYCINTVHPTVFICIHVLLSLPLCHINIDYLVCVWNMLIYHTAMDSSDMSFVLDI